MTITLKQLDENFAELERAAREFQAANKRMIDCGYAYVMALRDATDAGLIGDADRYRGFSRAREMIDKELSTP